MGKYRVDFYGEDMMSLIRRDYVVAPDVESAREYAVKHTALIPDVDYKFTEVSKSYELEKEFEVVDYFDVIEVEDGAYEVNDLCKTDYVVSIAASDNDVEILEKLKAIGFLTKDTCISDVTFEWMDDTVCEISEEDTMYPIGKLQLK